METNLRQAENKIVAEGYLAEKNLELKKIDGVDNISGSIVLQTSEDNFVTFKYGASELRKDKKPNGNYSGVLTVYEQYKSIAEAGKEECDKVRVTKGQLNPYVMVVPKSGEKREINAAYRTNFVNRLKTNDNFEPKATFEVELFVNAIVPEMKQGADGEFEETGRMIVIGFMPTFSGIEKLELIAPNDGELNWAELISDNYQVGMTGKFYGSLVNKQEEIIKYVPLLGGAVKEEKETKYKNELLITGASDPYVEGDINAYNPETIKAALAEKEIELAKRVEEAKNGTTAATPKSTATSGRTMPNMAKPSAPKNAGLF